jgi:hypothetical protein
MRALPRSAPSPLASLLWREAAGRDRRVGERLLAYWEGKLAEFGDQMTLAALDLGDIARLDWSNRFLISIDPVVERSSLVIYGKKFASLLQLPEKPRPELSLLRQLPHRYVEVFLEGCEQAQRERDPVRLEGRVGRRDAKIEQYRLVFIPVGVRPKSLTYFALGAFNNRVIDPLALALAAESRPL